jgi:hypothetical protein
MTKLEAVLERVRQLPPDRQDAIALELEFMLTHGEAVFQLTPEQEAELERRLADAGRKYISHEDVAAHFEKKYGR